MLMKSCKVFIVIAAFLLNFMGMPLAAQAMLTGSANGGSFTTYIDPVSYHLCDMNGTDQATPGADAISFISAASQPVMECSKDGTAFGAFDTPAAINFGGTDMDRISFCIVPDNDEQALDAGYVPFRNYGLTSSTALADDLFQVLYYQCVGGGSTSTTINSADDLANPGAPIPASALMLFTGLIGLIGFRRRLMNR